jgi:serine/threonine-protein kinase
MALPADVEEEIVALRRQGNLRDAADLCVRHGDPLRAAEMLAESWDYAGAISLATRAARLDVAYRYALVGEQRAEAVRLLEALSDAPDQARSAAAHAEAAGRLDHAARLMQSAADVSAAAELFERAGDLFEAARCREAEGRYRDAGLLYERRVRESQGDAEAALRLGRILAHFGRFEHAVRALQTAAEDPDRAGAATRLLVASFAALGLDEAAASRLDALRKHDPTLPLTVPDYLLEQFGDERGIAGLSADGDEDRLLAGRYRITKTLGAGATGRVLLAHDGFYDRDVAVKVLTVGGGAAGRDAYARFAREARVAAGLDHPNVVQVFEFNADGPFLVMEHMPGGTLEDRLVAAGEGQALPLPVIRHVLVSITTGLEAVHRRGVVHRDLKPANVFFGATGDVKIGDFGVAHLTDLGSTLTGALLGTLAYMSPEQITGSARPDASTDFYALGVILHRMLTGALPFPGPDFVTQHLSMVPPPPSEMSPSLGTGYDALVAALLAKEPQDRPRVAADVKGAAEALSWEEMDVSALELAMGTPRMDEEPREASRESAPPPADERWIVLDPLPDGGARMRDSLLDRVVRFELIDDARAERLSALGRADCPYLQAVFDVDREAGRAILEEPRGRSFDSAEIAPNERARALADVRRAVDHMHLLGIAHGAVDAAHIRIAAGRAILLLPEGTDTPSAARDLSALRALEE